MARTVQRSKRPAVAQSVPWKERLRLSPRVQGWLRIALYLWTCAAAIPLRFHPVTSGLDASWAFALHYFRSNGLLHGSDVAFTYGPFGWLIIPMNVGSNLWPAALFVIGTWLAFAAVSAYLFFIRRIGLSRACAFALLTY
jgi:hypothetical protein